MSVTLTAEYRDAIRENVGELVGMSLGPNHHDVEPLDRVEVVDLAAHLATSIRVLDALGWEKTADRDSYAVHADADVVRLMEHILRRNEERGGYTEWAPVKEAALIADAYAAEQAERSERRANEAAIAVANIRSER